MERALKIASKLDDKVERAIDLLELTKTVTVEGKGREEITASTSELVRLLELSHEIQREILGDASEDRVAAIQVNFNAYLKEFDYEQPENVQARRRAELARQGLSPLSALTGFPGYFAIRCCPQLYDHSRLSDCPAGPDQRTGHCLYWLR